VPDEVQRAFTDWLKNIELTRLMGEGERVAFWRRFLTSIEKSYASRDKGAVFVCFEKWFAVQFVLSGHATYFFEKRHLYTMRTLDKHSLYRVVLQRTSIGSYTHQGSSWSWRAESEVRRVMGMYP
jgi:hypothetical protein